ncbi:hypothetical protein ACSZMW_19355 [Aeromonas allosaccharophila]
MIKSIRRRKYDSMVEPRPCCSFLRPVKSGDGPVLPGITRWIGCQTADNPLGHCKSSATKIKYKEMENWDKWPAEVKSAEK